MLGGVEVGGSATSGRCSVTSAAAPGAARQGRAKGSSVSSLVTHRRTDDRTARPPAMSALQRAPRRTWWDVEHLPPPPERVDADGSARRRRLLAGAGEDAVRRGSSTSEAGPRHKAAQQGPQVGRCGHGFSPAVRRGRSGSPEFAPPAEHEPKRSRTSAGRRRGPSDTAADATRDRVALTRAPRTTSLRQARRRSCPAGGQQHVDGPMVVEAVVPGVAHRAIAARPSRRTASAVQAASSIQARHGGGGRVVARALARRRNFSRSSAMATTRQCGRSQ